MPSLLESDGCGLLLTPVGTKVSVLTADSAGDTGGGKKRERSTSGPDISYQSWKVKRKRMIIPVGVALLLIVAGGTVVLLRNSCIAGPSGIPTGEILLHDALVSRDCDRSHVSCRSWMGII